MILYFEYFHRDTQPVPPFYVRRRGGRRDGRRRDTGWFRDGSKVVFYKVLMVKYLGEDPEIDNS